MKFGPKFTTNSIVFLFLWFVRQFHAGDAVESNITAELNSNVTLKCQSSDDNDVRWQYSHDRYSQTFRLYDTGIVKENFRERFRAQNATEKRLHLLKISNVHYNDSGYYICTENNGLDSFPHLIYLKVVDPLPERFPPNKIIVIATVAAAVALTVIIVVIVFVVKRRKSSRKKSTSKPVDCTDETSTIQAIRPQGYEQNRDGEYPAKRSDFPDYVDESIKSKIRHLKGDLEYLLEFHVLIAKIGSLLTDEQVLVLHREKKTVYEQISSLLDYVSDLKDSDCMHFLEALEASGQKHVANYIRKNGKLMSDLADDERPLENGMMARLMMYIISSETDITKLRTIIAELKDCKSITNHQKRYIDRSDGLRQAHERLVEVLTRRTAADFNRFIELLRKHGNDILADQLEGKRVELGSEQHDGPVCQTDGPYDQTDFSIPLLPAINEDNILAILRSHFPRIIDKEDSDIDNA